RPRPLAAPRPAPAWPALSAAAGVGVNLGRPAGAAMTDRTYPVPPDFEAAANVRAADYARDYAESVADPEAFFARLGQRLLWSRPYTRAKDTSFALEDFRIRWYADGQLNASVNCLDRHLAERGDQVAILWEPDDPNAEPRRITYRQ